MKEFNVMWQHGTLNGVVTLWAVSGQQAYLLASPALAAISKEKGLMYMNVTVEPRGE